MTEELSKHVFKKMSYIFLNSWYISCYPDLIWDSINNHLHFSYVRIQCLLSVSSASDIWLVKKKKSLHWPPWDIDALIDDRAWFVTYLGFLEMSDVFLHESLSLFVVKQGLISEFLTVNEFNSSWMSDNSQASCVSSDPITTLHAGASLSSKRSSSERPLEKKTMIVQNLMIQWNPIFVLINIIELILPVNSWFLFIFSIASDLRKINRLNTFSEHARPLILSQEEVLIELE